MCMLDAPTHEFVGSLKSTARSFEECKKCTPLNALSGNRVWGSRKASCH